jgi:SsrA-binding protein
MRRSDFIGFAAGSDAECLNLAVWVSGCFLVPIKTFGYDALRSNRAMTHAKKTNESDDGIKIICRNKRALHEYNLFDALECGIVLTGTEVKSLRDGSASLEDAYAKIMDGEIWLLGSDIPEYAMGNRLNHKPKRPRKLLMHRREIAKFAGKASERGYTLVPLKLYFKGGRAKVELAVARGKQVHDKRQDQKTAEAQREIRRAMRNRR